MNQLIGKLFIGMVAVAILGMTSGCATGRHDMTAGERIDNAAITGKVKAALLDDPEVKGTSINVETFKGTVQLNGFVESADQKERAEAIAWGVDGVRKVENNLTLRRDVSEAR